MQPPDISVIVPTYNEKANLPTLLGEIGTALDGLNWEVIVVDDDSPDGTAEFAKQLAGDNPRIRCIRRLGRRGLASACIEGLLASSARFLAVMDADLQHDPAVLRTMYEELARDGADLVIGSRYVAGGSIGQWDERRLTMSRTATRLSRIITRRPLTDPMSGYFALKRTVFDACAGGLSSLGFKILLDIVASARTDLRIREVPIAFGTRAHGESKLGMNVAWEFLLLLLDKLCGKVLPARFLAFAAIGCLGIGVHFLVLYATMRLFRQSFVASQATATAAAILFNFTINNALTYAGASLHGLKWLRGLLTFYAICGIGATANVGVAGYMFSAHYSWPVAAISGVAMSAVWNYALSARYTWKA